MSAVSLRAKEPKDLLSTSHLASCFNTQVCASADAAALSFLATQVSRDKVEGGWRVHKRF